MKPEDAEALVTKAYQYVAVKKWIFKTSTLVFYCLYVKTSVHWHTLLMTGKTSGL